MTTKSPAFLGRGWAFPPRFPLGPGHGTQREGTVAMVAGDEDIQESLRILMTTRRGERIMRPRFGLGLWAHVADTMDDTTLADLQSQIEDAILFWEPRIRVEEITFDTADAADGVLHIHLSYRIPAINSRSNMVFPYYTRGEGTNVRGVDEQVLQRR